MEIALTEAAKVVGKSKQALSLAIRQGRLSATKDRQGAWQVDTAELFRVYPSGDKGADKFSGENIEVMQAKIAALEESKRLLIDQLSDVREDRDTWRRQAEQLLLALPGGSQSRPGFWGRIFGGRRG